MSPPDGVMQFCTESQVLVGCKGIYECHFRSNITVPVTLLCMIQLSKAIPHFVRLYITYIMVKSETKKRVELEDIRLYIR